MVNAVSISKMLALLEAISKGENRNKNIFVTLHGLKQVRVDKSEALEVLDILSTDECYKCLEVLANVEKDSLAHVNLLDNFDEVRHAFAAYINYVRDKEETNKLFQNEDWQSLEKRFKSSGADVDWSQSGIEIDQPIKRTKDYNTTLMLVGNDVVLDFNDESYGILKTLRTDQAPFFFLKYMIMHPYQVITKTVIQTEVEMCATKNDMTELVRQCGIGKELKKHFFQGTTKDKVIFTPHANLSLKTVSEGYI